jgi:hypothetical protein
MFINSGIGRVDDDRLEDGRTNAAPKRDLVSKHAFPY